MVLFVILSHLSHSVQPLFLHLPEFLLQIHEIIQNEGHCQLSLPELLIKHHCKKVSRWADQNHVIEFDCLAIDLFKEIDYHIFEVVNFLQLFVLLVVALGWIIGVDKFDDKRIQFLLAIIVEEQTIVEKKIFIHYWWRLKYRAFYIILHTFVCWYI